MAGETHLLRRRLLLRRLTLAALSILLVAQLLGGVFTIAWQLDAERAYSGIRGLAGSVWDLAAMRAERGYRVLRVDPGSPALDAGLEAGDVITDVDGVSLAEHPESYFRSVTAGREGASVSLTWLRDGARRTNEVVLSGRSRYSGLSDASRVDSLRGVGVGSSPWGRYGPYLLPSLLMLIVGAVIGFLRPRHSMSYHVALLLLVLAQTLSIFIERTPTIAVWPMRTLAGSLAVSRLAIYPLALLMIDVLAVFPNPSSLGRWFLRRKWVLIPYALLAVENVVDSGHRIFGFSYLPRSLTVFLGTLAPWPYLWLILLTLAGALLVAQHAGSRGGSRRRLGIVEAGFVANVVGGLWVLFVWKSAAFWGLVGSFEGAVAQGIVRGVATFLPIVLLCGLPASLAYAIFARRVFGIRLIVRRGIRYLLLSRGVLIVEGVIIFAVLVEAIQYSQRQIGVSVAGASAIAAGVSLLIVAAMVRVNRPLLRGIDKHFFRESYDAHMLLLDLSRQMQTLRERDEVLQKVGDALRGSLHPSSVGFFVRDDAGSELHLAWQSDARVGGADSGPGLAGADTADLVEKGLSAFEDGGDCVDVHPDEVGRAGAHRAAGGVELLVALRGSAGLLGCVALGAKLSEEPYSGEDKALLVTVATQMGFAMENARLLEVAKKEAEHTRELSIARRVQQDLFPKTLPTVHEWEFAAVCKPARAVGGDYYDVFSAGEGHIVLALGDVSGKGLGPSLVMSGVHAMIRSRFRPGAADLPDLMSELNHHLLESCPSEMFMTLLLGVLDLATGRLEYINAGHNHPLLFSPGSGAPRALDEGGTILGMLEGAPYALGEVDIRPGCLLVVYSDGVTEAMNEAEGMYGEEAFVRDTARNVGQTAGSALAAVLRSVESFSGSAEQADDISLIIVSREK